MLLNHIKTYLDHSKGTPWITENTNLAELGSPEDGLVPAAWYLSKLDENTKAKIADIVRKAVA